MTLIRTICSYNYE